MLKARHAAGAALAAGVPGAEGGAVAAIADDSGLEVDALGGAPGILSPAMPAWPRTTPPTMQSFCRLWRECAPNSGGRATGVRWCSCRGPDDAAPLTAEAAWEGVIIDEPQGSGGFGYDPYFWLPELGLTAAQLPLADKSRLSHRGRALGALRDRLGARTDIGAHPAAARL